MPEVWVPTEFHREASKATPGGIAGCWLLDPHRSLRCGASACFPFPPPRNLHSHSSSDKRTRPVPSLSPHSLPRPGPAPLQTFTRAGVDPRKLVVLPEPVDVDEFDPASHQALPLPLGTRVFGPSWPHAARGGEPRGDSSSSDDGGGGGVSSSAAEPFVFLAVFKWEARKVCVAAAACMHLN